MTGPGDRTWGPLFAIGFFAALLGLFVVVMLVGQALFWILDHLGLV